MTNDTDARRHGIVRALVAAAMVAMVALAGGFTYTRSSTVPLAADSRASAIPADFHAQSTSWISPTHGWMLGSAPCGVSTCTTVDGTTDGGATWTTLGTIDAPLTLERKMGVTQIRFADDLHGWAFDPALWTTSDGGVTWTPEASLGGGRPVVGLAGNSHAVYAAASACKFGQPVSDCQHTVTLWRTRPGLGSWSRVSMTLPVANQAVLAVHGPVAYLIVPVVTSDPDVLEATVDGQTWSARPDPCVKTRDEVLTAVAPLSDTKVALLCVGDPGFSKAVKRVLRSNDTGQTTSSAGTTPLLGIVSQLAATPNGTLVVTSFSSGSWIYRNDGGQTWATAADEADGGQGWNDVVFVGNRIGFVVHSPAASPGHSGELWETQDGGATWAPV